MQDNTHANQSETTLYKTHGAPIHLFNQNSTTMNFGKMAKQVFWLNKQEICCSKTLQSHKANYQECSSTKTTLPDNTQKLKTLLSLDVRQPTLLHQTLSLARLTVSFCLVQEKLTLKTSDFTHSHQK